LKTRTDTHITIELAIVNLHFLPPGTTLTCLWFSYSINPFFESASPPSLRTKEINISGHRSAHPEYCRVKTEMSS